MRPILPIAALGVIAAAIASQPAWSAEPWVPTKTFAHQADNAVMKDAMKEGESLHVVVTLQVRDKAGLDALASDLLAGRARTPLSHDQFMARHAPTPDQVQAVVDHLTQAGFTHIEVAPNRMLISADGTAAAAGLAFHTRMAHFDVEGRDAYANVADAQVPAHLGKIVNAVLGLQTVALGHTHRVRTDASNSKSGIVVHDPTDFPIIYNAQSLPPATNTTIAILAEGNVAPTVADLTAYASSKGFPQVATTVVNVNPPSTDTAEQSEFSMDSQSSLTTAGGQVKGMMFYVGADFTDATLALMFNGPVADDKAQVINGSLGGCETESQSSGLEAAGDLSFEIGIGQGQLFMFSSGDSGSYECGTRLGGQSYPAVSPWVVAVGGTTLHTSGNTTWTGETVWSCSSALTCNRNIKGGAGGGSSKTEAIPSWQAANRIVTGTGRGVPDIALDADPSSGMKVLINGGYQSWGGTSLASPLFTGFWARIQSAHNNALTFMTPALYGMIASEGGIFHDVTSGSNGGYKAASGWDFASGFGSFDIGKFAAFIDANPGF